MALIGRTHDTPCTSLQNLYDVMHDSSLWRTVLDIRKEQLMNCCNLISLDLGYNTSISSLHFVRHMPSLRELDITSCQNITLESVVTSLKKMH